MADRLLVLVLALGAAACSPSLPPPTVASPTRPPDPKRSVGPAVALAVLAAGGMGSGIGFAVVSSSNKSGAADLRAYITAHSGTCIPNVASYAYDKCPALQGKLNAYVMFGDAAVGAFVVGGAAAAGTALYLLWPSPRPKTGDVRLMPILGPTGSGLLVFGQF